MKHRFIVLLALGSASACAWLVSACSGDTNTTDGGGNDATTNDVATNDTGTSDTGKTDTGTDGGGGGDAACAPGPGCRNCCAGLYPDAAAGFLASEQACACTTPGDCKTACGNSLCQNKPPNGGCQACLADKDAGDCFTVAAVACLNDPNCQALAACVSSCGTAPTDAGPTDAGGGG